MFEVLHSSAGAGKTHALVRHYLTHCLRTGNAAAYRNVLALTFTNKAAAEMKDRVVRYLECLASDEEHDPQIANVIAHLEEHLGIDHHTVTERAREVLSDMIHHWGDVAITTIDSFTRRLVRPFARDLQLDHDLRMTTEEEHYRSLAVDSLISEVGKDATITRSLTEACRQLLHEERKWDPAKPLLELSMELGKERSIQPLELLGTIPLAAITALSDRLRSEEIAWTRKVRAIGNEAMRLLKEKGIAAEQMAYGARGIHNYFRKLSLFEGDRPATGSNVLEPLESGKWHSTKASAEVIASLDELADELTELFQTSETLMDNEYRAFRIRRAVARELLPAFTLRALNEHLWAVKNAHGVAFFSDLTRKVAEMVKDEPVSFIHERMGARYRHYLIDEFQDTSLLQWGALLPLLVEALGSGGSVLLVGDAKQAIYRFRNGEVQLFTDLPKIHGRSDSVTERENEQALERSYRKAPPLEINWRSAPTIIEFNNTLFRNMRTLLPERLLPVFDEHEQQAGRTGQGLVRLRRRDPDLSGEERTDDMLSFVLECVQEAIQDGFPPGSIAVLARSIRIGRAVADHLITNGFEVISPDGSKLVGDPTIELIIDLLRVIQAGDASAAARVLQHQAVLNAKDGDTHVDPFRDLSHPMDPLRCVREWLQEHGAPNLRTTLTVLIADVARAFGTSPAENASVMTLLNDAHEFANNHGPDIGGFLEHWDRSGGALTVASSENDGAVRIMTIHKAKGLQFPVVIVADTTMSNSGGHRDRLWIEPGDAVPELPVALVRDGKDLAELGLKELVKEQEDRLLDAMNLLYVAFTRPEQRLYALAPGKRSDDLSAVILEYMEEHGDGANLILGERGGPWSRSEPTKSAPLIDVTKSSSVFELAIRWEAPDQWDPLDPDPFRQAGVAIHEVLARIRSRTDLAVALGSVVSEGLMDAHAADRLAATLAPLLASEALDPWFGDGLVVRTEATLVDAHGASHRPDRVVMDEGVVRVLDIKTGVPLPKHHDQVRGYMGLLHELGQDLVEGALLYLPDGELIPVTA